MWMGAWADLVILEEEYPAAAWIVFSHLLTAIPCIIGTKSEKQPNNLTQIILKESQII